MSGRDAGFGIYSFINLVEINPFDLSSNYWSIHTCDDLPLEKI